MIPRALLFIPILSLTACPPPAFAQPTKNFPRALIEPMVVAPNALVATYRLVSCTLRIEIDSPANDRKIDALKIRMCGNPIKFDAACIGKLVEPDLATLTVMSTSIAGDDFVQLFIATKVNIERQQPTDPPFVKIEFDRHGLKRCDEILQAR